MKNLMSPSIDIVLAHDNKSISFKHCNFKGNYHASIFISISIKATNTCHDLIPCCLGPITNISFDACQFSDNVVGELMNINASITMKPYIKGQYYMITTIPLCDNYFLVVII